eukprot:TRINITY_DN4733_c0_g1_i1.p1 TRINITY_DN4733_c0_g1~~TRINITY_DN4733_c0_g1_i1.p1  ORF type:complete len:375 (-),score=66.91 TRINITY_DN4733_c0_g1_i1:1255-2328(-)
MNAQSTTGNRRQTRASDYLLGNGEAADMVKQALTWRRLGKPFIALDLLDRVLGSDAQFVPALTVKLSVLEQLKRHEDVLTTVEAIGKIEGSDHFSGFKKFMCLGQEDEALEFLEQKKKMPALACLDESCYLCGLLCTKGRVSEAITIFTRNRSFAAEKRATCGWLNWLVVRLESLNPTPMTIAFKVKVLMELGQYEQALQDLLQLSKSMYSMEEERLQLLPKTVYSDHEAESLYYAELVLDRLLRLPFATPIGFQLCFYREMVAQAGFPDELCQVIASYASEWTVYDLQEGDLVNVAEDLDAESENWYESTVLRSCFDQVFLRCKNKFVWAPRELRIIKPITLNGLPAENVLGFWHN